MVDGKAQSTPVQVTRVNGGKEFIVDEGLTAGEVIVTEGVGLLREGTPIKAKNNINNALICQYANVPINELRVKELIMNRCDGNGIMW